MTPVDQHLIAVDCDLQRMHAWSTRSGRVAYKIGVVELGQLITDQAPCVVLYEISSPVMYGEVASHSKLRWALWNMAMAVKLEQLIAPVPMVVAPSHVWTRGHRESVRHKLANCQAKNHDLRECECMLWFYRHEPQRWIPLASYLEAL